MPTALETEMKIFWYFTLVGVIVSGIFWNPSIVMGENQPVTDKAIGISKAPYSNTSEGGQRWALVGGIIK